MAVARIENRRARRVFLDRHGLARSPRGTGKGADLQTVVDQLGFVQLDSVNTFARAHDLILWSRRQNYRPDNLVRLLAVEKGVFEHWTHDASAISMQHFPQWRLKSARDAAVLEGRWKNWRRDDFTAKIDGVLNQIAECGCCTSGDVGTDETRGKGGWWDWHPSKTALEYLWRSGKIAVARREGFRKVYDLTERVIPAEYRNAYMSDQEIIDWACNAALDKLGFATSGEIASFWDIVRPAEAKAWCAQALADGQILSLIHI